MKKSLTRVYLRTWHVRESKYLTHSWIFAPQKLSLSLYIYIYIIYIYMSDFFIRESGKSHEWESHEWEHNHEWIIAPWRLHIRPEWMRDSRMRESRMRTRTHEWIIAPRCLRVRPECMRDSRMRESRMRAHARMNHDTSACADTAWENGGVMHESLSQMKELWMRVTSQAACVTLREIHEWASHKWERTRWVNDGITKRVTSRACWWHDSHCLWRDPHSWLPDSFMIYLNES